MIFFFFLITVTVVKLDCPLWWALPGTPRPGSTHPFVHHRHLGCCQIGCNCFPPPVSLVCTVLLGHPNLCRGGGWGAAACPLLLLLHMQTLPLHLARKRPQLLAFATLSSVPGRLRWDLFPAVTVGDQENDCRIKDWVNRDGKAIYFRMPKCLRYIYSS